MHIQWYPGHMTKAVRMMEENVKLVDAVLYVLDARAYKACFNPTFDKIAPHKPRLYILNKADMVNSLDLKRITQELMGEGKTIVASDSTCTKSTKQIINSLRILLNDKIIACRRKGIMKPLRAMVIGVPNSGKSTLINSLCGSKRTVTGDKPGVTRGKQWVVLDDGIELLDTPGTLWPSFENQAYARHLAYIGCIKDDVLNNEELALAFLKDMMVRYPRLLEERYSVLIESTPIQLFEAIAQSRGFVMKGGIVDYSRTATTIIDDFRKMRFGKVALE